MLPVRLSARQASRYYARPFTALNEPDQTQRHFLCGFAASSGVLNLQGNKMEKTSLTKHLDSLEQTDKAVLPNKRKDNVGVQFLRVVLSFTVIMAHFLSNHSDKFYSIPLHNLIQCAAPAFMFLSFIFMEKVLSNPSYFTIRKRIIRLLWPYAIWGTVSWCISFFAGIIFKSKVAGGIQSLFWQLATGGGHHINAPLWYIAVLVWITLLYFLLFFFLRRKAILVINLLAFFCIILQYTGWNYELFKKLSFELSYPLGRIAEMIPYATLGFDVSCGKKHIVSFGNSPYTLFILLFIALAFFGFNQSSSAPGFGYQGMFLLLGTASFTTLFYLLPLQKLPEAIKRFIGFIGAHTLGIYCMHYPIGNILKVLLEKLHIEISSLYFVYTYLYSLFFPIKHYLSIA